METDQVEITIFGLMTLWQRNKFHALTLQADESTSVDVTVLNSTGAEDYTACAYSIYPNPNNGAFTITNEGKSEQVSIQIVDAIGKTVYNENLQFAAGSNVEINLEAVNTGIYTIKFQSENGTSYQRMVIE